jgi:hypothetical protein
MEQGVAPEKEVVRAGQARVVQFNSYGREQS